MKYKTCEDLDVWKRSMKIAEKIYLMVRNNDAIRRDFGLSDQIRRSAVSIVSNIAEGFERQSTKDFAKFLYYAKGSAGELRSQVELVFRIGLIQDQDRDELIEQLTIISKQLSVFIKKLKTI